MSFTDAEVEAIKVYRCLFESQSHRSTADVFGCRPVTVQKIVCGKTHTGKTKRMHPFSVKKRDKIHKLYDFLQTGPKTSKELIVEVGPRWWFYLKELRKKYEIENKRVWVMVKK